MQSTAVRTKTIDSNILLYEHNEPKKQCTPAATQHPSSLIERIHAGRGVPCFIVAPVAFGRSTLAYTYAKRAVDADDVLWLDGSQSIFQNGLENGVLLDYLNRFAAQREGKACLLVIDDLLYLDDDAMTERLSDCLDAIVEQGWEVIVITTPLNDRFENLQSDRALITGHDLLQSQAFTRERRQTCVRELFNEDLPLEFKQLAALMVILQQGTLNELRTLGYAVKDDTPGLLRSFCPLIEGGEGEGEGRFALPDIALGPLEQVLREAFVWWDPAGRQREERDEEAAFGQLTKLAIYLFDRGDSTRSREVLALADVLLVQAAGHVCGEQGIATFEEACVASMAHRGARGLRVGAHERSTRGMAPVRVITLGTGTETAALRHIEPLRIHLFGGLEVWRSDDRVDDPILRRSKVRHLLVYLALNCGHSLPRDAVIRHLWPDMDATHARENFYVTWSRLNRTLGGLGILAPKCSPYIGNNGALLRMDPRYVSVDTTVFEELSKQVLFGQGSFETRIEAFYSMERIYRDEIPMSGGNDEFVVGHQQRFRSLMVDAMLTASQLFAEMGNLSNAVWFARKAYDSDRSREDVYRALMDAQMKSGQRTSALKTYFACKKYLTEELGILPSQSTTALFQTLIQDKG